ncbi:Endoribonuclease L-PSP family protein [Candidatus Terasakiella magnetica]|uniref:Endoribonuclease L-PSP family protein n=1 Tax=Candidatus Terasakiella magnetica TaxID=1867952 RepID=A0A1C3RD40_9PROT|nr:RidA family protein [Candidatus Terasakiella magnetica]SCA55203.1 Endoribonuclease L-PSP family protein [Candidatus Terasakiella magnetica]
MAGKIDARLNELGITLPTANKAVANYVPYVITGNLIHVSGQITMLNGELKYIGRLGENLGVEDGMAAARLCGLNLITQVKEALGGDLDRVTRVVKLGGFVNGTPEFTDQPQVINGASDLMVEVFGDVGRHARAAVGVASLPLGISVEIDGIFEFE